MRLSGWQRLGIIASVAWVIVGGYLGNDSHLENARRAAVMEEDICISAAKSRFGEYGDFAKIYPPCRDKFSSTYIKQGEGRGWAALIAGLGPLPFAWLFGWGILALIRWVRRGFAGAPAKVTDMRPRR